MQIQTLNPEQVQKIYNEQLKRDFPPDELKPLAMIEDHIQRGIYEPLGIYDENGTLLAYAFVTVSPKLSHGLLDYLAVLPALRGTGLGSQILPMLSAWFAPRLDGLIIESENPDGAPDPATANRRLTFYRRAGCRQMQFETKLFGVHYRILTLPCGSESGEETVRQDMNEIYNEMISDPAWRKNLIFLD